MVEAVGFAILEAVGVTGATALTAQVVGTVAIASVSAGANALLNQPKVPQPQDGQVTTRQANPPRRRNYGLVKVAGPIIFTEVKSGVLYQVVAVNHGEIASFDEHWLADNRLLLDSNGFSIIQYQIDGALFVSITPLMGTEDDAAYSALTTVFPELWTSEHRGRGIAKVLISYRQPGSSDFTTVYPGARPPNYRGVIRASKVWDPRRPEQDKDVPSTWAWTQNPVLIALDYHRHADGMGFGAFDDLLFTAAAIEEDWMPAAGICDEAVFYKAGNEGPRYVCSGGYELPNNAPKDVLAAIMATCDGQTYQRRDGALGIRVGKTIAPTITINDDMILGYESLRRGATAALGSVNQITAKYTATDLDFQIADADPWRDEADISATGREETRNIDLSWVINHNQARRLMKLAFARANPDWSGKIITNMQGMLAYNERYITLVISELGIDGSFEITSPIEVNMDGTCVMSVASLDQSAFDFDPAIEEGTEPSVADASSGSDDITPPAHVGAVQPSGTHYLLITWDASDRTDVVAVAEYSIHNANNWFAASVDPSNVSAVMPPSAAGHYDVRVRWVVGTKSSPNAGATNINLT